MVDTPTRDRTLAHYPMLRELPTPDLDELLASATYMKAPAGMVMFDENQPCMGFPLLLSGSARVIKAAPSGRELHLYNVLPGETCILTSSCLLGKSKYQARGLVSEQIEFVVLPPGTFRWLFARLEPFRDHVFSRFSERLTELLQLVSAVTFQKLDQRLATALLAKRSPIHMTHQALADELGSLRELVSRLLKHFAEQGWVRLGREQIDILDEAALRRFVTL
jgi:CRP/FNR family transcriptional regulator, anaerobic regulatory protein